MKNKHAHNINTVKNTINGNSIMKNTIYGYND